jgi:hypothetical protein
VTHAVALLLVAFAVPPDWQTIVGQWQETAAVIESADVELVIERDSRDGTFGERANRPEPARVRLRFDQDLRRLDVVRSVTVRPDGRTQPAEADPDRARIEFRNALLEDRLAGSQRVPRPESATLIIHADKEETGQKLSLLDRLLAEAPLWSAQVRRLAGREGNLEWQHDLPQSKWHRVIAIQPDDVTYELWLERSSPYRPLRIIGRRKDRPFWQVDLEYSPDESRFPVRYFVQTIGDSGQSLDFVQAALARVQSPMPPDSLLNLAEMGRVHRDDPRPTHPLVYQLRAAIRKALDSLWLPLAVMGWWAFRLLRRRPPETEPEPVS